MNFYNYTSFKFIEEEGFNYQDENENNENENKNFNNNNNGINFKNINIDFFPEKNYATYNNKKKWKITPGTLVDELSVYLALSQDIKNNPSHSEFTYQVALEDKVKFQTFIVEGNEVITINNEEINTTLVNCPDLDLTLNLYQELEFLPVLINKINKKNTFRMVLQSFEFSS